MTSAEFRAAIAALGMSQGAAAEFLGVSLRSVHGWARGGYPVPETVAKLIGLMVDRKIGPDDLRQTAGVTSATLLSQD
jgi:DNA-binding transcriptional regulator YdaS (Cro superfamily)